MVIADETKWVAYGPCEVLAVWGFNNNASDRYIQFHEAVSVANGDVPAVKSLFAPASTGFNYSREHFGGGLSLRELLVAISSTEVNYTALTDTGLDLTILISTRYLVTSNTAVVGDLTTGVAELQVWADSAGPKKLKAVVVENTSVSDQYLLVFARDTPAIDDLWQGNHWLVPAGEQKRIAFGDGLIPFEQEAGTKYDGCTLKKATSDLNGFNGTPDFYMQAIYEPA